MKLRILSDLHIEFYPFAIPRTTEDDQTILILAGDIGVIHQREELESFLRAAAKQFRAVIYVLGNHEFYRGVWPDAQDALRTWNLPDNLHVLERQWVRIDDIIFVGATLWTDFEGGDAHIMEAVENTLNDYHYIRVSPGNDTEECKLKPTMILDDHRRSLAWLDKTLGEFHRRGERCVLVTHHGVSHLSIHDTYRDNPLNGAFVSDCTALIERSRPELAIHGHVHNSFDYRLGRKPNETRVIVNPRGYTRSDDTQENPVFDPVLTIDLEDP